jgi:hypothetical protein
MWPQNQSIKKEGIVASKPADQKEGNVALKPANQKIRECG